MCNQITWRRASCSWRISSATCTSRCTSATRTMRAGTRSSCTGTGGKQTSTTYVLSPLIEILCFVQIYSQGIQSEPCVLLGVGCQHHRHGNQGLLQQKHGYHGRGSQDEPYSEYTRTVLCRPIGFFHPVQECFFLVSKTVSCSSRMLF